MTGYIAFFFGEGRGPRRIQPAGALPCLGMGLSGLESDYRKDPAVQTSAQYAADDQGNDGIYLELQTIASAMAKKIRLYTLVIEIFATDRQDAAISPMTTGLIPERRVLQVNIVLKFL